MKLTSLMPILTVAMLMQEAKTIISSETGENWAEVGNESRPSRFPVPTASLTQKGYIQFLKYVVDVPEITDYTFCVWVRSNNLTYNHPLLSYSKNEKERLIRAWISPQGTHINLELLGEKVFSIATRILENQWYHLCQSWSSHMAAWSLYLNGNLQASGHRNKIKNVPIPSGGDMVVGQEYTDFDKGLDDGIEGDLSGFNLVLASTFNIFSTRYNFFKRQLKTRNLDENSSLQSIQSLIYANQVKVPADKELALEDYIHKPLGLLLVELGQKCGYLRGAPLSGKKVLISWTTTEVRVFGGAILKMSAPFCIK